MQLDLTSIIVAIISLIGVIGGAWLGYTSRNKKQLILDAQREQNQMCITSSKTTKFPKIEPYDFLGSKIIAFFEKSCHILLRKYFFEVMKNGKKQPSLY